MIRLSDLQLDVMNVLWSRDSASVGDVHEALAADRDLAYTTVATLLKRLEDRGAVQRSSEGSGRAIVYEPAIESDAVRRSMVANLVDQVFRGDPAALVSHLLGDDRVGPDELRRIRALLDDQAEGGDES